jgi:hypothetical protein
LLGHAIQHPEHAVVLLQNAPDRSCAINVEGLQFAERQQSRDLINITTSQQNASNGRISPRIPRMQRWRRFDLQTQIGRGVQQKPGAIVVAYRDLGLGPALAPESPGTKRLTVATVAIPLWKTTSCGRAQDFYAHPCRRLQCGRGVGVDLTVQRNFLERRCCPFHDLDPFKNGSHCPRSIQSAAGFIDKNLEPKTALILKYLAQGYFSHIPYLFGTMTLRQACSETEFGFN